MGFYPAALVGSQLLSNPVTVGQGGTGATTAAGGLTALGGLVKQAATPVGGYTLVNGTGTIISWAVPNDGALHGFLILTEINVTSAETGGLINVTYTLPNAFSASHTVFTTGLGTGSDLPPPVLTVAEAGTTVTLQQASALTVGAAVLWAEIWGL